MKRERDKKEGNREGEIKRQGKREEETREK